MKCYRRIGSCLHQSLGERLGTHWTGRQSIAGHNFTVMGQEFSSWFSLLIVPFVPKRALCSQAVGLLVVPKISKSRVGERALGYQGKEYRNFFSKTSRRISSELKYQKAMLCYHAEQSQWHPSFWKWIKNHFHGFGFTENCGEIHNPQIEKAWNNSEPSHGRLADWNYSKSAVTTTPGRTAKPISPC